MVITTYLCCGKYRCRYPGYRVVEHINDGHSTKGLVRGHIVIGTSQNVGGVDGERDLRNKGDTLDEIFKIINYCDPLFKMQSYSPLE